LAEVRRREMADQRAPTPFVLLPELAAAELGGFSGAVPEPYDGQPLARRIQAELAGAPAAASV
jgi:hypothetical protein